MDTKPRFLIEIEAQPDAVPWAVRLRRALKCLLRSFGLRVIDYRQVPPEEVRPVAAGRAA